MTKPRRARTKESKYPWLKKRVPDGFWSLKQNRRRYMDWLGKKKGFRKSSDWYRITKKDFYENDGGGLLANFYGDSPFAALKEYRPRRQWKAWLLKSTPQGFWKRPGNRRAYMDWLGKKLWFTKTADWYQITKSDFYDNHGGGMLANHFDDSPVAAVMYYKPRYRWKVWLFKSVPQGFWQQAVNRNAFMDYLGKQLRYRKAEDWYKVSRRDFLRYGGGGLLAMYQTDAPLILLREYLPIYKWSRDRFSACRL